MDIALAVIGMVIGWLANAFYSRQGSRQLQRVNADLQQANAALRNDSAELKALMTKLPADFVAAVMNDSRARLTFEQLDDLARTVGRLSERDQPRRLSDQQRATLHDALRQVTPEPIGVYGGSSDSESMHFGRQIGEVFQSAGWTPDIRTALYADMAEGIHLVYQTGLRWEPQLPKPAIVDPIAAAFAAAGLPLQVVPVEERSPPLVYLAIGHKPRM